MPQPSQPRRGRKRGRAEHHKQNLLTVLELLLDLAGEQKEEVWKSVASTNVRQALVVRWDDNKPLHLLVTSAYKDPAGRDDPSLPGEKSLMGTKVAIRRCLNLLDRKLLHKGRKVDTEIEKFELDQIGNALNDLNDLQLRIDTSAPIGRPNHSYWSFWLDFSSVGSQLKRDCLGRVDILWQERWPLPNPNPDSAPLETLKQWVDNNFEEWKQRFTRYYEENEECQLFYVSRKLHISLSNLHADYKQPDDAVTDVSKVINPILLDDKTGMIRVVGESGSGKTSLLIQIAKCVMEQKRLPILLEPPEDITEDIVESARKQLIYVYPDVNTDRVRELLKQRLLIIFIDQYSQRTEVQQQWCKKYLHPDHLSVFVLVSRVSPGNFQDWPGATISLPRLRSEDYQTFFRQLLSSILLDNPSEGAEKHAFLLAGRVKDLAPTETTVRFAFLALRFYAFNNFKTKHFKIQSHLAINRFLTIHSWGDLADEYLKSALSPLLERNGDFLSEFLLRLKLLAIKVFEQSDKYCSQPFNKAILESAFGDMTNFNGEVDKVLINSSLISKKLNSNSYEFSFSCLANLLAALGLIQGGITTVNERVNDLTAHTRAIEDHSLFLQSLRSCLKSLGKEDPSYDGIIQKIASYLCSNITSLAPPRNKRGNLEEYRLPGKFIGRDTILNELIAKLTNPDYPDRIIKIIGVGGAGKTALAIEAASRIYSAENNPFNVIYCQSAKIENRGLIGRYVNDRGEKLTKLENLITGILSYCYSSNSSSMFTPEQSKDRLKCYLEDKSNRTLIILDSLESLESSEIKRILNFFDGLRGSQHKLLLTTREESHGIEIGGLSPTEAAQMIDLMLDDETSKSSTMRLNEEDKKAILIASQSLPLAIVFFIGELYRGKSLDDVINESENPSGELCEHLFGRSFKDIKSRFPACLRLLYALSFAPDSFQRKTLLQIAKAPLPEDLDVTVEGNKDSLNDEKSLQEGLNNLDRWSWVVARERPGIMGEWYSFRTSLIRGYVLKELDYSRYYDTFRDAWVNWYVEKAKEYGNEDYGDWHQQFDNVSAEFSNFEEVWGWCYNHWVEKEPAYDQAKELWRAISRFLYLYSHFQTRLDWSQLIQVRAENKNDKDFLPELYNSIAWLAIMKDGDEDRELAAQYLERVENHLSSEPTELKLNHLIIHAVLKTRCRDFSKASEFFASADKLCDSLLAQLPPDNPGRDNKKRSLSRAKIRIYLYTGEMYYREEDHVRARALFETAFSEAEKINWVRFMIKASERLAYLDLREGNLSDAERRLKEWELRAEMNKDRRRMAFFHRDFAELHLQKEEFDKATERATQAKDEFNMQSMKRRVLQMDELLKKIEDCRVISDLRPI